MKPKISIYLFALSLIFITGACKKDEGTDKEASQTQIVNQWVFDGLHSVYLWNNQIPQNINPRNETDPKQLFEKMIYRAEDRWSWITDDYPALEAELQGIPMSMGYSPAFGLVGQNQVAIVVENVYPGSPAAGAGLKRGDIILKIDGSLLDTLNYYSMYSRPSYTAELGVVQPNRTILPSGTSITMSQAIIEANPIAYHEVLTINGNKTGYLVYNEFISGINGKFKTQLGDIFDGFKNEGIQQLIVDLRYNPGGEINAAAFLASCIAPQSVVSSNSVLVRHHYNDEIQNYYVNEFGPEL